MWSQRTATKIANLHSLDVHDIRDQVECRTGLAYTWHVHPARGERALVETYVRQKRVIVVLYDANHPLGDVYHLGSAYPIGS